MVEVISAVGAHNKKSYAKNMVAILAKYN